MKRRRKFTIYHGFAASLAVHSVLGLPFVVNGLAAPPDEPPMLVIELQGAVADSQTEQKVLEETKGAAKQPEAPTTAPSSDAQPTDVAANENETPPVPPEPTPTPPVPVVETRPPTTEMKAGTSSNTIPGTEQQQIPQTIRQDPEELDRLKAYVKVLTKKVQANLAYPDEGRHAGLQGTATVSFAILGDGQIRSETLKVIASSGQTALDAGALKTIRASAPFAPPPKEITVAIAVTFARKR
jgi:periplasmic protein TonB